MKNGDGTPIYKPDWPVARQRWSAFWDAQATGPEALMIRTSVETREEGEELLRNAVKWAGSHVSSS